MSPGEQITAALTSWPGVESEPHRFGGTAFNLGRRQLGHIHGDSIADIPFPKRIRDELVEAGRARPHRWTKPGSGWVTVDIGEDPGAVIELFRMTYDRAVAKQPRS